MLDNIEQITQTYIPTILDYKSSNYYWEVHIYFFENQRDNHVFNCKTLRECYVAAINAQKAAIMVCEEDIFLVDVKDNDERVCCVYISMERNIYKLKIYKVKNKYAKLYGKPNRKLKIYKDYESVMYVIRQKSANPNFRLNINDQMEKANRKDFKDYYDDITQFCIV